MGIAQPAREHALAVATPVPELYVRPAIGRPAMPRTRTRKPRSGPRPPDQRFVRRVALALPEASEGSHMGHPDLRVRNKVFAGLAADGRTVALKTTPANLDALVTVDPETFRDAWGGRWVGVVLARVSRDELRDLIVEAWRLVAPKRLTRA